MVFSGFTSVKSHHGASLRLPPEFVRQSCVVVEIEHGHQLIWILPLFVNRLRMVACGLFTRVGMNFPK